MLRESRSPPGAGSVRLRASATAPGVAATVLLQTCVVPLACERPPHRAQGPRLPHFSARTTTLTKTSCGTTKQRITVVSVMDWILLPGSQLRHGPRRQPQSALGFGPNGLGTRRTAGGTTPNASRLNADAHWCGLSHSSASRGWFGQVTRFWPLQWMPGRVHHPYETLIYLSYRRSAGLRHPNCNGSCGGLSKAGKRRGACHCAPLWPAFAAAQVGELIKSPKKQKSKSKKK